MKKFALKNKKKPIILVCDLLIIPAMFFCEALSDYMLSQESVCTWVKLGGKCPTCGGTHFVNYLLNGRIFDAFESNQFLFVLTLFLAISYLFLNLWWVLDLDFAKKVLSKLYNIPAVILWMVGLVVFTVIRNIRPLTVVVILVGRLLKGLFGLA